MASPLTCEFPITLAVSGDPAGLDLDAVGAAVEEAVVAQLQVCRAELPRGDDGHADPDELTLSQVSSFLIREGYIRQVAALIGPEWRSMSQAQLTAFLTRSWTEPQIREMFLETYLQRNAIKARFRTASVVSAVVLGLVWAQDNIRNEDWGTATAKVTAAGLSAFLLNRLLYARDPAAAALMAHAPGAFGRWFQSAATSNRFVNFVVRDLNGALLAWQFKDVLMSGGTGPNIPFDVIYDVDVDDPSTWRPPSQTLLDLGFDIYYRQIATERYPQAAAGNMYLSMVEGSAVTGLLKALDIAPSQVAGLRGRLFRVVGRWDPLGAPQPRDVTEADRVLVLTTGTRSGQLIGWGGHYWEVEIVAANEPAQQLFGGAESVMVPESLLWPYPLPDEDLP